MAKRGALDQKVATLNAEIAEMERVGRFVAKHGAKAADEAAKEIARLKDIRGYLGVEPVAAKPRAVRKPRTAAPDPADETTRMAVEGNPFENYSKSSGRGAV